MSQLITFGLGRFQIGGTPAEQPPTMHVYACIHDQPTGADVPLHDRSSELVLTLQFHDRQSIDAMVRALERMRTWFPPSPLYSQRTTV